MNQTFVGCSLYHLYASILMAYEAKRNGNKSLMILINDRVPGIETLIPGLQKLGVFDDIVSIKSYSVLTNFKKHLGTFNYLFNRQQGLRKMFERENPQLPEKHDFILNSEINIFHVVRTRAYFLIRYPDNYFRMVEEGLGTYMHRMPVSRYLKRKYLIKFPIMMGYDDQVKEVLVQHPEKLQNAMLRKKAVKFEFGQLQEALSDQQKKEVLECFLGEKPDYSGGKRLLLITQPYAEDGHITEEQKIAIYRKIIDEATQKGYTVYLKTHPREATDYTKIFPGIRFIPQLFPIEVLNLSRDFHFEVGITIFSSALDNLKNVDHKITIGAEILPVATEFIQSEKEIIVF